MSRVMHLVSADTDLTLVAGEYQPGEVLLHVDIPDVGTIKGEPGQVARWLTDLGAEATRLVDAFAAGAIKPRKAVKQ